MMNYSLTQPINTSINFEMCIPHHLSVNTFDGSKPSSPTDLTLINPDSMQMISIIFASLIGFASMFYGLLCSNFNFNFILNLSNYFKRDQGLKLHFIGIRRPNGFNKSQYKLFENINTESTMITIETSLKLTDTISDLKQFIKKIYDISTSNDILILYSHHIISYTSNNDKELKDFGITNNSLLTLAICDTDRIDGNGEIKKSLEELMNSNKKRDEDDEEEEIEDPVADKLKAKQINNMFEMYDSDDSDDDDLEQETTPNPENEEKEEKTTENEEEKESSKGPRLGFDIIMQEENVPVHEMPVCGHDMNKESLYQYALNTFNDRKNLHLQCPHKFSDKFQCETKWDYWSIIHVLTAPDLDENGNIIKQTDNGSNGSNEPWFDLAKLEILTARNKIENDCNVQKCPRCKSLYFKNKKDIKTMDEIKTINDIENEFKTECVLCDPSVPNIDPNKLYIKPNPKPDRDEEAIDPEYIEAVNTMFGMFEDEEDDDDDAEHKEEENENEQKSEILNIDPSDDNYEPLQAIQSMFDDEPTIKPNRSFCFCCGSEWYDGHICDNSFRRDLVEILSVAELKKIGSVDGVPSIRCCPSCCQLILHTEACKHMECRRCKTYFCFVCLKPRLPTGWQCGSHGDACPPAPPQDMDSLPDNIVITKQKFQLFENESD